MCSRSALSGRAIAPVITKEKSGAQPVSRFLKRLVPALLLLLALRGDVRAQNPIITENSLPGNPKSEWDITGAGDMAIQGFATDMSVNKGSTVRFKIDVQANTTYSIRIYRLGYYQGNGARRVDQLGPFNGIRQPSPVSQSSTGLVDCGNWTESATWNVPATAVSGVYIAKLIRTDNGGSSHIVFVVRDDQRNAGLLFKTSDATWQAYNVYGGNSLYTGSTSYPSGHAVKVSYNRPFITREGGGGGGVMEDWLFNAEYPMIRWLERNGYDMVYSTDVDMERDKTPITPARYKALLSVGHDEYWSLAERTRVENARDAGVHLAFFSGNEVYWKTRWENSIDGSGTPNRTLVCYKEGTVGENVCGNKCDPLPNSWTGLWRSGCQFSADGCKPENALTGQISWMESTGSIRVTDAFKDLPIWRNTSIASLGSGQSVTFPNGTLGYEWDAIDPDYAASYPAGRQALSRTTVDGRVHELSLYQHSSGALVFGAGTIQWSWGLDNVHDRGNAAPSRDMQQATVNLFSDMGVQPGSLQADLLPGIPAGDTLPPTAQITFPANLAQLASGRTYSVTGTATDSGGGTVSMVEVSTDNGTTWQRAQGTGSWFYSWTPADTGNVTIRARAVDNSGNQQLTATIPSVTVRIGQPVYSIWPSDATPVRIADPDMVPIEVGVKFRPKVNGFITGIRFYKGPTNTGTHIGSLWTASGTNLGRATFSGETSGGWQEVQLPSPVPVTAGTIYVASYHTNAGQYSSDEEYFTGSGVSTPYLEALGNGVSGDNGLYTYSATPTFPTQGYRSTNFWVDVTFTLNNVADTTPPAVSSTSPAAGSAGVSPISPVTVRFSEPVDATTVTGSVFQLRDSLNVLVPATVTYDAATWTATLKPAAPLSGESRYIAAISGTAIRDLSGNPLAAAYTWDFRTSKEVFSIWGPSDRPVRDTDPDEQPVEVGVKFRPLADGFITGIRFYKSAGNTGTHVGSLWTRAGIRLAQATFVNESAAGWQEVLLDEPVEVTAGTVYVASYHTNTGRYASDLNYFTASVGTPYLEALRDGADGVNGVYRYTADPAFPSEGYLASNFWVDVVFETSIGPDTTPPHVLATSPLTGDTGVSPAAAISAIFNEPLDTTTLSGTTFQLRDSGGNLLNAVVSYQETARTALLTPEEPLAYNSSYTAVIKGQPAAAGIRDRAGNALAGDYTWTFSTGGPPPVPPAEGPGGPILVISTASNPFSRYPVEILRAEGLNAFTAMDISQVSAPVLSSYDVVILGEVPLTAAQVTMLTNWTLSGGTFIAFKPDSKLAPLMGLTRIPGSLANRYLKVNAGPGPGSGIVSETIQFHGSADLYTLNGASALATLYSAANTPTANPAVTTISVGPAGGRAIAFTYDLARSIVYTRQGNPAWAGQERDGQSGPIRSDDLFFGDAFFDSQPDWIDLDKVSIPQADEQQRLLANIMITSNLHRKPLPRFWYLPKGLKAAVVMTGDDHGNGGTTARFDQYRNLSPSNTAEAVANWNAIRGTSYIYPGTPLTNQSVIQLQQDGFEIALHLNTGCSAYTAASLTETWTSQGGTLRNQLPGLNPFATSRTHCMPWSDWATQAKVQAARGVRIDVNYYYWPGSWV
ncbi:MAG TPA: N,N-dimethylformamidase beta subunit family domain-containing protein, partial [Sphingobacteriaceae bacterium]